MNKLSIRYKLICIVALLLLPIGLLAWLFVDQSQKGITFAEKEADGAAYLEVVWPALSAATSDERTAASISTAPIAEKGRQFDEALGSVEAVRAVVEAGRLVDAATRDEKLVDLIAALRALISQIADGSNLTLDPDLDSYYMQDAVTVKMPEAIDRASALLAMIRVQAGHTRLSDTEKADLTIGLGAFDTAMQGVSADLAAAFKGNADGTIWKALENPLSGLVSAADAFREKVAELAASMRDDVQPAATDIGDVAALHAAFSEAGNAIWLASRSELVRLLEARIHAFNSKLLLMLGFSGGVTLLALAFSWLVLRSVVAEIADLDHRIRSLKDGDLITSFADGDSGGEFGVIVRSLETLRTQLVGADRLRREAAAQDIRERQTLARREQLAERFVELMQTQSAGFSRSSREVADAAENLSATAEETSRQALNVSTAADEASQNVHTVASATEEMAASVEDISSRVFHSVSVADTAFREAEASNARISHLADAATSIGEVVSLIRGIADQTNLLALNATIEAARAGDAGRGFAVVASEVKQLATQTGRAMQEIDIKVGEIQHATGDSVRSMGEIVKVIADMKGIATAIAGVVAEQGQATGEIAKNCQLAAAGTQQVTQNIAGVGQAAEMTGAASHQLMSLSSALSSQAGELGNVVEAFVRDFASG